MFDVTLIKNGLIGLVGFRQPANPKYQIIAPENLTSVSGLFVNDNPYAKIEYLKDNHDYSGITDEQFNKFLKELKETSITNICNQVFDEPDFIHRDYIFTKTTNKVEEVLLQSGFTGYKVKITDEKNVSFKVNSVVTEFVEAGTYKFVIYNSNLLEPIFTQDLDCAAYYDVKSIDFIVNDNNYYKGTMYIGFLLTGTEKTYKHNFEDSDTMNTIENLYIEEVVVSPHVGDNLFDLRNVKQSNEYVGFNLDLTVLNDYTNFILNNKSLFSRAIYLDCIVYCLNVYAASLRRNMNQVNSDELYARIMLEIEGTRPDDNVVHVRGLRPQMLFEISQIRQELSKLKQGFVGKGYYVDTQD